MICPQVEFCYRCLGQSARSAVAEYLQILSGGEGKTKKITLRTPAHPSIEKALEIVRKHFRWLCLEDQGLSVVKKFYKAGQKGRPQVW